MILFRNSAQNQLVWTQRLTAAFIIALSLWTAFYTEFMQIPQPFATALLIGVAILASVSIFVTRKEYCFLSIVVIWIFFATRNPFSVALDQFYVAHLLIAMSFASYLNRKGRPWTFLKWQIWILLGVGYLGAAVTKFLDPVWQNGSGMQSILTTLPLPYDSSTLSAAVRVQVLRLPDSFWIWASYSAILTQALFLPAIFFPRARLLAWCAITSMQVIALLLIPIPDICIGMLSVHLFCYPIGEMQKS